MGRVMVKDIFVGARLLQADLLSYVTVSRMGILNPRKSISEASCATSTRSSPRADTHGKRGSRSIKWDG